MLAATRISLRFCPPACSLVLSSLTNLPSPNTLPNLKSSLTLPATTLSLCMYMVSLQLIHKNKTTNKMKNKTHFHKTKSWMQLLGVIKVHDLKNINFKKYFWQINLQYCIVGYEQTRQTNFQICIQTMNIKSWQNDHSSSSSTVHT